MVANVDTIRSADRPASTLITGVLLLVAALVPAAAVLDVPTPILAVVGGFLGVVLLTMRPDAATLIVVGIVYSNAAVIAVRFYHVPFTIAAGSIFLVAVPVGYFLLIRREKLIIPPAMPWILGYLFVQMVSTLFARDTGSAAGALGIFVTEGLLLYLLVVNAVRTERVAYAVIWVLLGVGVVLSLLTMHQEFTNSLSNDYLGFAQRGGDPTGLLPGETFRSRPQGPLDGPNRYAQVLVLLLPLALSIIMSAYSRRATLLAVGATVAIGIAIALTLSRGAAVGFALVVAVMFVLRFIRLRNLLYVAAAVVLLFFVVPEYGSRLQTLEAVPSVSGADGSVRSRLTEMIAAALVFADHPIVGVGPGQFPAYYPSYADEFGLRVKQADREAHNLYVGIASESGILGTFLFFGAIGVTMRDLFRTRRRLLSVNPRLAHLAGGLMLTLVAYLTTGIFLHLAMERYLWLMMALGAAVYTIGLQYAPVVEKRRRVASSPAPAIATGSATPS